jgi:hypothetical protein
MPRAIPRGAAAAPRAPKGEWRPTVEHTSALCNPPPGLRQTTRALCRGPSQLGERSLRRDPSSRPPSTRASHAPFHSDRSPAASPVAHAPHRPPQRAVFTAVHWRRGGVLGRGILPARASRGGRRLGRSATVNVPSSPLKRERVFRPVHSSASLVDSGRDRRPRARSVCRRASPYAPVTCRAPAGGSPAAACVVGRPTPGAGGTRASRPTVACDGRVS